MRRLLGKWIVVHCPVTRSRVECVSIHIHGIQRLSSTWLHHTMYASSHTPSHTPSQCPVLTTFASEYHLRRELRHSRRPAPPSRKGHANPPTGECSFYLPTFSYQRLILVVTRDRRSCSEAPEYSSCSRVRATRPSSPERDLG